jgi:hypothetical protein
MSKPKTPDKASPADASPADASPAEASPDAAQAARERELRRLIENVEQEKSGAAPPAHESAHDFIERRMRETKK